MRSHGWSRRSVHAVAAQTTRAGTRRHPANVATVKTRTTATRTSADELDALRNMLTAQRDAGRDTSTDTSHSAQKKGDRA